MNADHRYYSGHIKGKGKDRCCLERLFLIALAVVSIVGCRSAIPPVEPLKTPTPQRVSPMGYTIQVGAFSIPGNALRLATSLQEKGLEAYSFPDSSGLFKVRFGNYASLETARKVAEELLAHGIITDFYLVRPEDYPGIKDFQLDAEYLRKNIVLTAERYLGLPYQWGGSSPDEGFDCSDLVMAAYQLNGLALPRTSQQQWEQGAPVAIDRLARADLIFFSFSGRGKVSHVGLHAGDGRFIHAPGTGQTIRVDNLSNPYFRRKYMGARTYL